MESVVHRVNAERLIVLGWSRAILMQLAHPLIAAGVARHSSFRGSATEAAVRLHHTVSAMLSLLFGSAAQQAETIARIRGIHRTVRGTLGFTAGPFGPDAIYDADDPALLLWVHLTLLDSAALVYERLVSPLTIADRDAMCDEAAPTLIELGGDPATVPRTWAAAQARLDRMMRSGELVVTDEGRAVADAVLAPRAGLVRVPFTGWHRLIAVGLLPPPIRSAYGFEWEARREARLQRLLTLIRGVRRVTPEVLARWAQARNTREPQMTQIVSRR